MSNFFDLVLFGATGFTGRQVAVYLSKQLPQHFRWAIAGRDQARLESLRGALSCHSVPDIILADAMVSSQVENLVASTKVVASTVGPFALYGELLIAHCAQAGVDYLDITGEPAFIHRMIERYGEKAEQSGAKIIPFCGFDSVPFDLGTALAVEQISQRWQEPTASVHCHVELRSGVNGGTFYTLLTTLNSGDWKLAGRTDVMLPKKYKGVRPQKDRTKAEYSELLKRWTIPHIMAPINSRVVNRSAALNAAYGNPYGPRFYYDECQLLGPLIDKEKAQTMAKTNLKLLSDQRKYGIPDVVVSQYPKPGEGPSDSAMDKGFYKLTLLGQSKSGKTVQVRFSGKGDPGNRATAIFVAEAAMALSLQRELLPGGNERSGFLTPATCLQHVLCRRLEAAGVRIEVEQMGQADG